MVQKACTIWKTKHSKLKTHWSNCIWSHPPKKISRLLSPASTSFFPYRLAWNHGARFLPSNGYMKIMRRLESSHSFGELVGWEPRPRPSLCLVAKRRGPSPSNSHRWSGSHVCYDHLGSDLKQSRINNNENLKGQLITGNKKHLNFCWSAFDWKNQQQFVAHQVSTTCPNLSTVLELFWGWKPPPPTLTNAPWMTAFLVQPAQIYRSMRSSRRVAPERSTKILALWHRV